MTLNFSRIQVVTNRDLINLFDKKSQKIKKDSELENQILITMFQRPQIEKMEELDREEGKFKGRIPYFGVIQCSGNVFETDNEYLNLLINGEYQKSHGYINKQNQVIFTPFQNRKGPLDQYFVYPHSTYIVK